MTGNSAGSVRNAGNVCVEPPVHGGFRLLYGSSNLSSYFRERKGIVIPGVDGVIDLKRSAARSDMEEVCTQRKVAAG